MESNPYLESVFAPVREETTAEDLAVIAGEVPRDLAGAYVRNGPNPRFDPTGRYHWFDGDGMLHALRFADGRADYRNRWVRTDAWRREDAAGRALWRGIMEPLAGNPADAPEKDTANTDVVFHRGRLLALWYRCGLPYAVDPETLETLGPDDLGGALPCPVSAHAKVDPTTGELFWFHYGLRAPYLHYGVTGPDGRLAHFQPVETPGPRLPHDMAITERFAILMDLPLFPDPEALRRGRHKIAFDRGLPSRFAVVPRAGGVPRWFEAEPTYIYHVINAWEDGEAIVLDACRVKRPDPAAAVPRAGEQGSALASMLSYLRLDAHVQRYRFDLRTGACREQTIDDDNVEFPAIDRRRMGRKTRYGYAMHISDEPTLRFDGVVRYDLAGSGARTAHWFGPGRWGSEAAFAPRAGAADEDDGYLVSIVRDEREGETEAVVLDARDLDRGPLARLRIPAPVPLGFHATWAPLA
jgi:carotenoid cleavage dioxygenase